MSPIEFHRKWGRECHSCGLLCVVMSEECDGSGGEDEALGRVADRDLADLRVAVAAGHGDEQGAVHVTDAHRPGGGDAAFCSGVGTL